jgi:hypothetical protein
VLMATCRTNMTNKACCECTHVHVLHGMHACTHVHVATCMHYSSQLAIRCHPKRRNAK